MFWGKNIGDVVGPVSLQLIVLQHIHFMLIHHALYLPVCTLAPYVIISTIFIFNVKFKISYFQVPITPQRIVYFTILIFILHTKEKTYILKLCKLKPCF